MFQKLPKELALESSEQVGADLGEEVDACLIWTQWALVLLRSSSYIITFIAKFTTKAKAPKQ